MDRATLRVEEVGNDERGPRVVLRGSEAEVWALAQHLFLRVVLEIAPLLDEDEDEDELDPSTVSSMAPAPWTAKGFVWDDAFSLSHPARGVVAMVSGQTVTIWSDDRSKSFEFNVPVGSDPRLFVWNKLCELSLHTCTPDDAHPDVTL
jgi:hypothetical protein